MPYYAPTPEQIAQAAAAADLLVQQATSPDLPPDTADGHAPLPRFTPTGEIDPAPPANETTAKDIPR